MGCISIRSPKKRPRRRQLNMGGAGLPALCVRPSSTISRAGRPILTFCAAWAPLDSLVASHPCGAPRPVLGSGVLLPYRPSIASPASGQLRSSGWSSLGGSRSGCVQGASARALAGDVLAIPSIRITGFPASQMSGIPSYLLQCPARSIGIRSKYRIYGCPAFRHSGRPAYRRSSSP